MMWLFCMIFISLVCYNDGLTRYTCMTSTGPGMMFGSSEEGGMAGSAMTGTLSCTNKPNTKILVSRIIHGFGNFRGCANQDETCDKEVYSDHTVASHCDGKASCFVQTFPKWLEKCSMMSDFVHVEYECVFDTSIFDVCQESSKVISDTSVFVVSPNVFQTSGTSARQINICECIINSRYSDQIIADYIHSDVYSNGDKCSDSYLLIESKLIPNQTAVDKEVEICGRRTVSNQMFRGSVRLTYYNRRGSSDDGFLTKFRVPPLDHGAELRMQCGPVRGPNDNIDHAVSANTRGPGFNSFRGSPATKQNLWNNRFNPTMPPFFRPPIPYFGATVPPFYGPGLNGWRNPPSQPTNVRSNPWSSAPPIPSNSPNTWNDQWTNNPGLTRGNSNTNANQNRPWGDPSFNNPPNFNEPPLQVPRDPRRFQPPPDSHLPPSAGQLGIATPIDNTIDATKSPASIDPRITQTTNDQNSNKTFFIPWTNNKKKARRKFIPWTPVLSNSTSATKSETIVSNNQIERVPDTTTTNPRFHKSIQFLGAGQTMKLTNRNPDDPLLPSPSKLPGIPFPSSPSKNPYVSSRTEKTTSAKGDRLAYIIGGVGAGMIGMCCIAFFFLYTKRRKSLRAMKERESQSSEGISDDPTYATPSDIPVRPSHEAHENEAYISDEQSGVVESNTSPEEEHAACQTEVFTVETQGTQTYTDNSVTENSVYDNNFEN